MEDLSSASQLQRACPKCVVKTASVWPVTFPWQGSLKM